MRAQTFHSPVHFLLLSFIHSFKLAWLLLDDFHKDSAISYLHRAHTPPRPSNGQQPPWLMSPPHLWDWGRGEGVSLVFLNQTGLTCVAFGGRGVNQQLTDSWLSAGSLGWRSPSGAQNEAMEIHGLSGVWCEKPWAHQAPHRLLFDMQHPTKDRSGRCSFSLPFWCCSLSPNKLTPNLSTRPQ